MAQHLPVITSRRNPLVKRVKQLQDQARARKKHGAYVIEGAVFVSLAMNNAHPLQTLIYCDELVAGQAERALVSQLQAGPTECVAVSADVFEAISQRNNPDGLAAIVAGGRTDLQDLKAGPQDVFICLSDISDPGNLGTILRTAESAGARGCILVGESTDPYHPRTVRASRGALFSVRVAHAADMHEVLAWAGRQGVSTVATSARGGQSYWEASYPRPICLVMGSEHEGLPADILQAADELVTIPMVGNMSSLNVAVATSLLLYELARQGQLGGS